MNATEQFPAVKIAVQIQPSLKANPNIVANATVMIETEAGAIYIHDCRLLRNKTGVVWFSLPTFSVQHGSKQFEYRPTVEIPATLAQQVSSEALRAFGEWSASQPGVK